MRKKLNTKHYILIFLVLLAFFILISSVSKKFGFSLSPLVIADETYLKFGYDKNNKVLTFNTKINQNIFDVAHQTMIEPLFLQEIGVMLITEDFENCDLLGGTLRQIPRPNTCRLDNDIFKNCKLDLDKTYALVRHAYNTEGYYVRPPDLLVSIDKLHVLRGDPNFPNNFPNNRDYVGASITYNVVWDCKSGGTVSCAQDCDFLQRKVDLGNGNCQCEKYTLPELIGEYYYAIIGLVITILVVWFARKKK